MIWELIPPRRNLLSIKLIHDSRLCFHNCGSFRLAGVQVVWVFWPLHLVADVLDCIELCESVESLRLFFARSALASAMFKGSLFVALVFMWYCVSAFGLVCDFNREVIFREVFINRQKNQQKCTCVFACVQMEIIQIKRRASPM